MQTDVVLRVHLIKRLTSFSKRATVWRRYRRIGNGERRALGGFSQTLSITEAQQLALSRREVRRVFVYRRLLVTAQPRALSTGDKYVGSSDNCHL